MNNAADDANVDVRLVLRQYEEQTKEIERLKSSGGGGTFDGMEPRVAKLEAHMEQVRAELTKLAEVPVDVASIKERLQHLPTKEDVRVMLDTQLGLVGTRVQRTVMIVGGFATLLVGVIGILLKLWTP